MQCTSPLNAYINPFKQGEKVVFVPPSVSSSYKPIRLPCGQCTFCRLEQSRQWAVRIMKEAKCHDQNSFLTLTYDDDHLPEHRSLNKKDLTLFFKRLRKSLSPKKIRYYAVGEYGDKTQRPHYHVILFGHDFSDDRKLYKQRENPLYESKTLSDAWPLGFANFGDVTFESAAYCARYCLKKVNQKDVDYDYCTDIETGEVFREKRSTLL